MRLLVLGGTQFMGPAIATSALARGWQVTTFNRGRSGPAVAGVEEVIGDRTQPEDLARLAGSGEWDAVIDSSAYVPRNVLDVARHLAPVCERYVLISTVSVYADWPTRPLTEASAVLDCPVNAGPDYGPADVEDGPTRYGRLKAGCENAVREIFGVERTTVARPGVVLGPGEYVGRLPWWLRRIAAGGRVVAPGDPTRGIQPIDVRDVAQFLVDAAAGHCRGTFNLAAPVGEATFGQLLQACRQVTGSAAEFLWVPDEQLLALGVRQWSELPLWRTHQGVWQVDTSAATTAGLRCRSLTETARDTWAWMQTLPAMAANERSVEIGLLPEREQAIIASLR